MKWVVAAVLLGVSAAGGACEPALSGKGVERAESARYALAYRPLPWPVTVGEHFALELAVCGKNGTPPPQSLRVDARMPAHGHGMNYRPAVERTGPGRWRAEGLMLHMPGHWEFSFELRGGGATDRLTRAYALD